MIKKEDILVLDTETTGFGPSAEILQLSIVNGLGEIVMNEYFRPARATCWPDAEAVNHISPAMVAGKPLISERKLGIEKILHAAKIISGYNLPYDQRILIHLHPEPFPSPLHGPHEAFRQDLWRAKQPLSGKI